MEDLDQTISFWSVMCDLHKGRLGNLFRWVPTRPYSVERYLSPTDVTISAKTGQAAVEISTKQRKLPPRSLARYLSGQPFRSHGGAFQQTGQPQLSLSCWTREARHKGSERNGTTLMEILG